MEIYDLYTHIKIIADGKKYLYPKLNALVIQRDNFVYIQYGTGQSNEQVRASFPIDPSLVTVPAGPWTANTLCALIEGYFATSYYSILASIAALSDKVEEIDAGSTLIGLPTGTNGDFVTTPTAGTDDIVCSSLPSTLTVLYAENIEKIDHFNSANTWVASYTPQDSVITDNGASQITVAGVTFSAGDWVKIYTNILAAAGGGGASATADYTNTKGYFNVTWASTTTLNITGIVGFTIINSAQLVYIRQIRAAGTSDTYFNAQNGVTLLYAAGTLIINGAGTPFLNTDVYEVGINGARFELDPTSQSLKNSTQNPDPNQYGDEIISETNLGIDGTATGGDADTYVQAAANFTAADIAEGYRIWNVTDAAWGTINIGGAGFGGATNIEHTALSGAAAWAAAELASIPQVKRFVINMDGYKGLAVDAIITANSASNVTYLKVYISNNPLAVDTNDTYWYDYSTIAFGGAAYLMADAITAGAAVTTNGFFIIPNVFAKKIMIKLVAECNNGVQANSATINIKKLF